MADLKQHLKSTKLALCFLKERDEKQDSYELVRINS